MNGFNPSGEAYVSPHHMMSFVGLESSSSSNTSSQKQQLWDWETTTPPPNTTAYQAPFFANNFDSASFYGFAASPSQPVAIGGAGGRGNAVYPFQPVQASTTDCLMMKSEVDRERQVIGLNLGHRTYFPAAAVAGRGGAVNHLFWRSRGVCCHVGQGQVPRCQAEGCKADLSGAKHYHRRHKVCELHSKATVVVAGGLQQRFCQQCSRFHLLSEFDEAKRSCRKRLAEHNRRRRKPQPPPVASANSDRSTPPDTSTNSTEKSKQTSPKSAKNTATKDNITTTATSMSTVSTLSQANISKERPKDYQKTATHLRNGPALSLGGAGGADKGGFGLPTPYHRQQLPWAVVSDENNSPQQPTQLISLSSSASIFVQSQNFCAGATEASQSTTVGDAQSNLL